MITSPASDFTEQVYPIIFDSSNPSDLHELSTLLGSSSLRVVDQIESQIIDLIKSDHPNKQFSKEELALKLDEFYEKHPKDSYGNWVYYPWKQTVVHLLPEREFVKIRTIRNCYKITPAEQEMLAGKKVGIVGLSVGQSIAFAMALERSCGEMRLADFDSLELSNLNRLKAGVTDLGVEKVVIAAREISEIDPYLKLTLYRDGVNENNVDDFLLKGGKLDLLIDECDSLDIKFLLREKARNQYIPVMMETSDRGMLDIERFDDEPQRPLFHGAVGNLDVNTLRDLSNVQKVAMAVKITGLDTLSPRAKASLLEVGQTISSWPQLASAVYLGGATVAHVGRRLLLEEPVKSGRFYVDLDDLVKVEIVESSFDVKDLISVPKEDFVRNLPKNVLPSGYLLSGEELKNLVESANQAPSGGNIQPWIWIFDKRGVLHLFHDQARSHSLLDFKGTGSLFAFGAALENLRLTAAKMGLEVEIITQIKEFGEDCIASIRFVSKSTSSLQVPYAELERGINIRCTSRKNPPKRPLDPKLVEEIYAIVNSSDLILESISENEDLETLSHAIGGMDRMRLFHEQGLKDFIAEVRWNEKEAQETKDGIDIATLELSGAERAAMGLLKDPRTVRFFRKFLMGYGLTKISHQTLMSSSEVFLLQAKDFSVKSYLEAGKILQRIWILANLNGVSFQPVTAALFIFHKIKWDSDHGFTTEEVAMINEYKKEFNTLFNRELKNEEIFMFRLNYAGEPSMRSYRRDVNESLVIQ
ncbi:Rv1355c family protein [Algoriphagus sp. CAU 1675]|uniref:Rv1355c family protein n=1 Tax=Algoriphagus sp. CAU 1675 TaxID=3032597 RepID=UPI0023DBF478|nr:Rv1355c family protein [Algoriphagus sp. CAU 1675]MDF2158612.1 Rv1355c family protein [Algoriphagus sp. CAU 1675]